MAFVSVDNPNGILHHGGQMSWCELSDTRVAMVTVTQDFKMLVQEINFVNNATVIGPATFVKAIPNSLGVGAHYRSKVFNLDNDRILVMVPTAFQVSAAYSVYGHSYWGFNLASLGPQPTRYEAVLMARNADATYTFKSSISIDFSPISIGPAGAGRIFPGSSFEMVSATPTAIKIWRVASIHSVGSLTTKSALHEYTITVANDIIQSVAVAQKVGTLDNTDNRTPYDMRYRKLADKTRTLLFTNASTRYGSWRIAADAQRSFSYDSDNIENGAPGMTARDTLLYGSPKGILPINKTDKLFAIGGSVAGANTYVNGTYQSTDAVFYNPLDTAWVTPTVACIAGTPVGVMLPSGSPMDAVTLQASGPLFDHDMCAGIKSGIASALWPLYLSFRDVGPSGYYTGPYDAIVTPYFYRALDNADNVIHRIDDKNFWLIGCFVENLTADPKLGVITVSV